MTRRRSAGWTTTLIAAAACVLLLSSPAAWAAPAAGAVAPPELAAAPAIPAAATPGTAPVDPLFVLRQAMSELGPVFLAASPHGLGLRPSPLLGYAGAGAVSTAGPYPAAYDLRTLGKLTPVRNQGAFGTCWTFAALGSLESSSLPAEALDLSEDNLALTSGFDVGGAATAAQKYDTGGNADMATAYLVRWGGPVLESDDA